MTPGTPVGMRACNPRARVPRERLNGGSTLVLDDAAWLRLDKLSKKAANDSMRVKGGYLAEDQFDELARCLLEIGKRALERFDATLTVSDRDAWSYAFRAMRGYRQGRFTEGPYVDWLRTNVRDSRFEPEALTAVTETGDLPERHRDESDSLAAVIESYAAGISERDAWTLRHVASAVASGYTVAEVVETLLADLADALRPQIPGLTTDRSAVEFFQSWFEEAA